jgi:hypothetical protein
LSWSRRSVDPGRGLSVAGFPSGGWGCRLAERARARIELSACESMLHLLPRCGVVGLRSGCSPAGVRFLHPFTMHYSHPKPAS